MAHVFNIKNFQKSASELGASITRKSREAVNGIRHCSKCDTEKLVSEFYKHSGRRDGLHSWCKSCCSIAQKESTKKRYATFDGRIPTFLNSCKLNARKRGNEFSLTPKDFKEMWSFQQGICAYSGIPMSLEPNMSTSVSVERVDNNIGYTKSNTVLVCKAVNAMKSDMKGDDFFAWCKSIVEWLGDESNNQSVEFDKYA
jgi:hypothetical protein